MAIYTASEARQKLYRLIDEVATSNHPVQITGKRNLTKKEGELMLMVDDEFYQRAFPKRRHMSLKHNKKGKYEH